MRSSLIRLTSLIVLLGGFSLDAYAKSEITLSFGVYSPTSRLPWYGSSVRC